MSSEVTGKMDAVDDKEYKFLTEVERTFMTTVASQNVTEHEKENYLLKS